DRRAARRDGVLQRTCGMSSRQGRLTRAARTNPSRPSDRSAALYAASPPTTCSACADANTGRGPTYAATSPPSATSANAPISPGFVVIATTTPSATPVFAHPATSARRIAAANGSTPVPDDAAFTRSPASARPALPSRTPFTNRNARPSRPAFTHPVRQVQVDETMYPPVASSATSTMGYTTDVRAD